MSTTAQPRSRLAQFRAIVDRMRRELNKPHPDFALVERLAANYYATLDLAVHHIGRRYARWLEQTSVHREFESLKDRF